MKVEEILNKIKEYRKDYKNNNNTHWFEKEIQLSDNGEIFEVNGFGICEDDNFKKGSFRYYLEFDINGIKNNKSLVVLLMNPSDKTNPKKQNIDNTIKNALKIGFSMNYSKVIILNSFAKICGDGEEAKNYFKELEIKNNRKDVNLEYKNKTFVKKFLENINEVLIACGDGVLEEQYQSYLECLENKKIWTYAKSFTSNSKPRHLSIQSSKNRLEFYEFINNPQKKYLTIKEDNGLFNVEYK